MARLFHCLVPGAIPMRLALIRKMAEELSEDGRLDDLPGELEDEDR